MVCGEDLDLNIGTNFIFLGWHLAMIIVLCCIGREDKTSYRSISFTTGIMVSTQKDTVTACVGLLTVSFLSLPLLSPSLAAGISLTFAIRLTRSLARGGMDCSRGIFQLGRLEVLCIVCVALTDLQYIISTLPFSVFKFEVFLTPKVWMSQLERPHMRLFSEKCLIF